MKIKSVLTILLTALTLMGVSASNAPKHEFRGAWMHVIFQGQYKSLGTEQLQAYLIRQVDSLQAAGVNAVLFQVRPQSDALYPSELEPWSRFLTDDGRAPEPYWDPLQFMIDQCHARGMELHAWLNPYRVTSNRNQTLPEGHIYHKYPERFIRYDGKLYFDPAQPENREFICTVVEDIVSRYDVDGIHIDDYFYPYPITGLEFHDEVSYQIYGNGMELGDWRRHNVDMLMQDLERCIHSTKLWVRFGVSPFGIWRNKSSDPRGSETNGLQNYDGLYADVLLWSEEGWVDYVLPQLYWELDHRAAPSRHLTDWWGQYFGTKRHLYIGQDVNRTMNLNELNEKVALTRANANIQGNCWWPGYSVTRNFKGAADSIAALHSNIALVPSYPWLSDKQPAPVEGVNISGKTITWTAPVINNTADDVVRYVIYRFDDVEDVNIENGDAIVAVQPGTTFDATQDGVYVITALTRVNNESEASTPILVQ